MKAAIPERAAFIKAAHSHPDDPKLWRAQRDMGTQVAIRTEEEGFSLAKYENLAAVLCPSWWDRLSSNVWE